MWGGFKIYQGLIIFVALLACCIGMISCQLECDGIMIEIMTKSINSVMTGQTICPEILYVALRKAGINLVVTCVAVALVITGVVLGMAIDANEWRSVAFYRGEWSIKSRTYCVKSLCCLGP